MDLVRLPVRIIDFEIVRAKEPASLAESRDHGHTIYKYKLLTRP